MRYDLNKTARLYKIFLMIEIVFFFLLFIVMAATIVYAANTVTLLTSISRYEEAELWLSGFHVLFILIPFLIWIYRATFNTQLKFGQQKISPAWAVGWNFIPIANFFMVYQALANLWRHFAPTPSRRGFLLGWWLLGIGILVAEMIVSVIYNTSVGDFESRVGNAQFFVIATSFTLMGHIISNVMEIRIITLITHGEENALDGKVQVFS